MKCYKPNDARCGDVIEHVFYRDYVSVFLIVGVDRAERAIESVLLIGSGLPSSLVPGARLTVKFSHKAWKRFDPSWVFLSRGWSCILNEDT